MATYTYEIQGRTVEFDQELDEEKLKEVEQYFIDLDAQTPTDEPVAPTPTQVNPDEITFKRQVKSIMSILTYSKV